MWSFLCLLTPGLDNLFEVKLLVFSVRKVAEVCYIIAHRKCRKSRGCEGEGEDAQEARGARYIVGSVTISETGIYMRVQIL